MQDCSFEESLSFIQKIDKSSMRIQAQICRRKRSTFSVNEGGTKDNMKIRKLCASRVEWKYIYQLLEAIEDKNIKNYVTNQIQWNVIKAYYYRWLDIIFKILTVFMPTLVVIVQENTGTEQTIRQAIVLAGATLTSATGVFAKWHEKRILYRKTAELLKEETILYVTKNGRYTEDERDRLFVTKVHKITYNATNNWGNIENEKKESQNKS